MLVKESIFYKLKEITKDPRSYHLFILAVFRRLQLKKVTNNKQNFFQYRNELYPEYLNQGNALFYIREKALTFCKGTGLDIGAGDWPLPGAKPIQNDSTLNAYNLDPIPASSQDFIFSSHCLEHLYGWKNILKLWIHRLKNGGILFLYLPHKSMKLWNPGGPWVGGHHKWQPTADVIIPFLKENRMEIIDYNPDKDIYWSFHIVARKQG